MTLLRLLACAENAHTQADAAQADTAYTLALADYALAQAAHRQILLQRQKTHSVRGQRERAARARGREPGPGRGGRP